MMYTLKFSSELFIPTILISFSYILSTLLRERAGVRVLRLWKILSPALSDTLAQIPCDRSYVQALEQVLRRQQS